MHNFKFTICPACEGHGCDKCSGTGKIKIPNVANAFVDEVFFVGSKLYDIHPVIFFVVAIVVFLFSSMLLYSIFTSLKISS